MMGDSIGTGDEPVEGGMTPRRPPPPRAVGTDPLPGEAPDAGSDGSMSGGDSAKPKRPSRLAGVAKAAAGSSTGAEPSALKSAAKATAQGAKSGAEGGEGAGGRAVGAAKGAAGAATGVAGQVANKAAAKGVGAAATAATGGNAAVGQVAEKVSAYVGSKHGKKLIAGVAVLLIVPAIMAASLLTLAAGGVTTVIVAMGEGEGGPSGAVCLPPGGELSFTLSDDQRDVAQTIVDVGASHGISSFGVQIALMTAMQESMLTNHTDASGGDFNGTSAGVFQQISQWGWGTYAQITDVALSTEAFFGVSDHTSNNGLLDIQGWQSMPAGQAAQAVQKSGFPDAYDKWIPDSQVLYGQLASGGSPAPTSSAVAASAPDVSASPAPSGAPGSSGPLDCVGGSGTIVGEVAYPLPLGSWRVTSPFDPFRLHPVFGTIRPHEGVDLAAPGGTDVYAFADGVVTYAHPSGGGGGNIVKVDHGEGVSTHYLHLSAFAVAEGDQVRAGQLIAKVGSTGLASTGNHLHFEYRVDGIALDPVPIVAALGVNLKEG